MIGAAEIAGQAGSGSPLAELAAAALKTARLAPSRVRYIKLGRKGEWARDCLSEGLLKFADIVPHEVAARGAWDEAASIYREAGETTVSDRVRELRTFYEAGEETLWITFADGRLWWAFAGAPAEAIGDGVRVRRTAAPWSCQDLSGTELREQALSSSLTQVQAYRRTICAVAAETYLLRRLNAEPDPVLRTYDELTAALEAALGDMIAALHWRDFETLVDLIFARSGWRRIGAVGGAGQADSDLILEQPATGERAFVQIKSKAGAAAFGTYQALFEAHPGMDRFFFVCHSPTGPMAPPADPRCRLWLRNELARLTLQVGLADWVRSRML